MAAPNIVQVATIIGKTAVQILSTTSATSVVNNAVSSGKVFKINSVIVANVDGTSSADITFAINSAANATGTSTNLASTVPVAPDSTLVLVDRASAFYLEEDKCLLATASAANDLHVVISYEEIS